MLSKSNITTTEITKFENNRTILTCLNQLKELSVPRKKLTVKVGRTDPNYRKASLLINKILKNLIIVCTFHKFDSTNFGKFIYFQLLNQKGICDLMKFIGNINI